MISRKGGGFSFICDLMFATACLFLSVPRVMNQVTGWPQDHGLALQAKAMVKKTLVGKFLEEKLSSYYKGGI